MRETLRKCTAPGRSYFFWGGVIVTVLAIAFFAAGSWLWGLFGVALAAGEFGLLAARIRDGD